jgi:hypothetical protein
MVAAEVTMRKALILLVAVVLAACQPKPEEPSAGLARCEAKLSQRVCRCAFDAMPSERFRAFAHWADRQPRGRSEVSLWEDLTLQAALIEGVDDQAKMEQIARELVFLKATCGAGSVQHASISPRRLARSFGE